MIVYCFPRGTTGVDTLTQTIEGPGPLAIPLHHDPRSRVQADGVRHATGRQEDVLGAPRIIVDAALGFAPEEIVDHFSFGNGMTRGSVLLKSGRWVPATWIVVEDLHGPRVEARLAQLRAVIGA